MVLVVLGGLNAAPEFTAFLRFRERAGWKADAIEMLINSQIPTNAVPNWISTLTGLSPDMVGILGNRNLGTTAYDNVFRMMSRFEDKWYCDTGGGFDDRDSDVATTRTDCSAEPYAATMVTSPWFIGLAKTDLPPLVGDGSTSYVANEEDFFDRSEVFQRDTKIKDQRRVHTAREALRAERRIHFVLLHLTDMDSQASTFGAADVYNQANVNATHAGEKRVLVRSNDRAPGFDASSCLLEFSRVFPLPFAMTGIQGRTRRLGTSTSLTTSLAQHGVETLISVPLRVLATTSRA